MGFESGGGRTGEKTNNKTNTKITKTVKTNTPEIKRNKIDTPHKIVSKDFTEPKLKINIADRKVVAPKINRTLKDRINQARAIVKGGVSNFVEKKVDDVANLAKSKQEVVKTSNVIKETQIMSSKSETQSTTKTSITRLVVQEAQSATNDLLDRVAMMGDLMAIDVQCGSDVATLDGLINDFITLDQPVFEKTQEKQGLGKKILNVIDKGAQRVEEAIGDRLGERATLVSLVTKYPALLANLKHRVADRIAQNNDPHQKKLIRLQTRIMKAEKRLSSNVNQ